MSPRKKVTLDDVLSVEAWPHRAFIGIRTVAGRDREGTVCIAEFGPDIYGKPVIKAFVTLEPDEMKKLRTFLQTTH